MIFLKAVPDNTLPAPGCEHQTFQCSACGDSERRLIFKGTSAAFSSSQEDLASPGAWDHMVERGRKEQAIRRCFACGEEMALVEAVPDDTMMVAGYEQQILQCAGCGESERRLIFKSRRSAPGILRSP
jgi:hypothetical protein